MTKRYFSYYAHFKDINENDPWNTNKEGRTKVEELLSTIIYQMNTEIGEQCGRVNNTNIWLIRQGSEFEYITYFKVIGDGASGYSGGAGVACDHTVWCVDGRRAWLVLM